MIKYVMIFVLLCGAYTIQAQEEEDIYSKAMVQYTLQDYIGAIETFDSLLIAFPKNKDAKFYRMVCKYSLNDYYGAKSDYEKYKGEFPANSADKMLKLLYDEKYRLKILKKMFYKDDVLYPGMGFRPKYTHKDTLRGALRPERTCYDVTFYNLALKIDPFKRTISGSNTISFKVVESTRKIQIDLYDNYVIDKMVWNNKILLYTRDCEALFVSFPEDLLPGSTQSVQISYSGKPRVAPNPPWDGGFVWKKDDKKNFWCGVSCEHLGASSWWPCKDHLSDEPDSMQMAFSVPTGYDVVSNGIQRSTDTLKDGYTRYTWFVSYPINNYNATFYMGKFVHITDTMVNKIGSYALDYYVLPKNLEKAKTFFKQTRKILSAYEDLFGEYPFMRDGFALVESPYQGMEHQGAIAYGNDFDNPKRQQAYVNKKEDMIIVHESAHEWWGNSVTVKDMADIWIQEGFATYAEYLYFEKQYGYNEYIREISYCMNQIFNFWPLIQNYHVNENAFASNDCYRKGAAILQSLRCTLNSDSLFFKIIKDFALRYAYKTVFSRDFERMVSEYSGQDFSAFFNKFLRDKNLPVLQYTYKKVDSAIEFSFKWTEVEKGFTMPFCISDGNKNYRLDATTNDQHIVLKNAKTIRFYTPIVSPEKADRNSLTYFWTRNITAQQK